MITWFQGLGFGVWGVGVGVWGLGFRVQGLGFVGLRRGFKITFSPFRPPPSKTCLGRSRHAGNFWRAFQFGQMQTNCCVAITARHALTTAVHRAFAHDFAQAPVAWAGGEGATREKCDVCVRGQNAVEEVCASGCDRFGIWRENL